MKSNNIIQEKSFAFAIRIVNLNKHLITEKKEFILLYPEKFIGCLRSYPSE